MAVPRYSPLHFVLLAAITLLATACVLPSAAWAGSYDGSWSGLFHLDARYGHAAVYDPVRRRMIVIGGNNGHRQNATWTMNLIGTPAWTPLACFGTLPLPRYTHSAVYDPIRDRVVVFGGDADTIVNDVWALDLAEPPTWRPIVPSGTAPPARYRHSAIYDATHDRMLVFGGKDSVLLGDAWALSLAGEPRWSRLELAGTPPTARYRHSVVFDPVRGRMIVFGGDDGGRRNDVWALELAGTPRWIELVPTGELPPPRRSHIAVYDRARDRMLAFGDGADTLDASVWELSLAGTPRWTRIDVPAGPSWRRSHSAVLDPVGDRLIAFGGETSPSGTITDETWLLALGEPAWSTFGAPGRGPSRIRHSTVYDPVRRRMLAYGGEGGLSGGPGDLLTLSLDGPYAWSTLTTQGTPPTPRSGQVAVYDAVRDRIIVYGGSNNLVRGELNDVWQLALSGEPTWSRIVARGTPPELNEWGEVGSYDPARNQLIVYHPFTPWSKTWTLSLGDDPTWRLVHNGPGLIPRNRVAFAHDPVGDRLVVFGGFLINGSDACTNVVSCFDVARNVWVTYYPRGEAPAPREGARATYDPVGDRILIFGGVDHWTSFSDLWALSLRGPNMAWTRLRVSGQGPDERTAPGLIVDWLENRMVLFAGAAPAGSPNYDTWVADFDAEDDPTPTLTSLRSVDATRERVRIEWQVSDARTYGVERRAGNAPWVSAGGVEADPSGVASFEDRDVIPGCRYGYRLAWVGRGGSGVAGETWVDVPTEIDFALHPPRPNPVTGTVWAAFSLPSAGRASLEFYDLLGRRVAGRELDLEAGLHRVPLAQAGTLDPGVYFMRLRFGGHARQERIAVVR